MQGHGPQRNRRAKIAQPVRVRPSSPHDPPFDDIEKTSNVSRSGLYFITRRSTYYAGMRLFVTLPFFSATDPLNCEYIGEVVRMERLDEGRLGIGVHLVSTLNLKPSTTAAGVQRK